MSEKYNLDYNPVKQNLNYIFPTGSEAKFKPLLVPLGAAYHLHEVICLVEIEGVRKFGMIAIIRTIRERFGWCTSGNVQVSSPPLTTIQTRMVSPMAFTNCKLQEAGAKIEQ